MKVQRVRLPETDGCTYLVLDDDYVPLQPIFSYLTFLHDLDRSPNTIRACAHHLKLFWEFLRNGVIPFFRTLFPAKTSQS